MMMGLDFLDDRRNRGVCFNHGCIHLIAEGLKSGPLIFRRRLSRLMGLLHGFLIGLFLLGQAGIGRDGGIMGLFQFRFFGIGEKA